MFGSVLGRGNQQRKKDERTVSYGIFVDFLKIIQDWLIDCLIDWLIDILRFLRLLIQTSSKKLQKVDLVNGSDDHVASLIEKDTAQWLM